VFVRIKPNKHFMGIHRNFYWTGSDIGCLHYPRMQCHFYKILDNSTMITRYNETLNTLPRSRCIQCGLPFLHWLQANDILQSSRFILSIGYQSVQSLRRNIYIMPLTLACLGGYYTVLYTTTRNLSFIACFVNSPSFLSIAS
jgi:hypothetical protein